MGRIKTQLIKRTTNSIVRDHADKLKTDFNENKKVVAEIVDIPSTKLRNMIAGYVTRQMRAKSS